MLTQTIKEWKRKVTDLAEKYDQAFKKSMIPKIRSALIRAYGEEKGARLYALSGERLLSLIDGADDRGNAEIRGHMAQNILPVVACYQVLQENGIAKEEACALAAGQMHAGVRKTARFFHGLTRLPFFYMLFRVSFRKTMEKSYPSVGWDVLYLRDDKEGVVFDCRTCVYRDTTALLGCAELCQYFCENDVILYGALQPKIRFVRTQTLAAGDDRCDFHFFKGKTVKDQVQ